MNDNGDRCPQLWHHKRWHQCQQRSPNDFKRNHRDLSRFWQLHAMRVEAYWNWIWWSINNRLWPIHDRSEKNEFHNTIYSTKILAKQCNILPFSRRVHCSLYGHLYNYTAVHRLCWYVLLQISTNDPFRQLSVSSFYNFHGQCHLQTWQSCQFQMRLCCKRWKTTTSSIVRKPIKSQNPKKV